MPAYSRRLRRTVDIWPGWVDALSTLLIIIIFVLLVFVLGQFFLGVALSGRDKALGQLSTQIADLGNMLALERAFKKISDELRSQYLITYKPADQNYDGRNRKIEVRFADGDKTKKYKIRTKTSYRAIRDSLK